MAAVIELWVGDILGLFALPTIFAPSRTSVVQGFRGIYRKSLPQLPSFRFPFVRELDVDL